MKDNLFKLTPTQLEMPPNPAVGQTICCSCGEGSNLTPSLARNGNVLIEGIS